MTAHRTPVGAAAGHVAARPVTVGWTAAGLVMAGTMLPLSLLLPPSLVLLSTGCVLATAGFIVAAVLALSGRRMGRDATTGWDVASSLVLLGFAAVLLTDMGEALAVLTGREAR
jgi:TRAP-type uncharacterized transport system fused permease subunit